MMNYLKHNPVSNKPKMMKEGTKVAEERTEAKTDSFSWNQSVTNNKWNSSTKINVVDEKKSESEHKNIWAVRESKLATLRPVCVRLSVWIVVYRSIVLRIWRNIRRVRITRFESRRNSPNASTRLVIEVFRHEQIWFRHEIWFLCEDQWIIFNVLFLLIRSWRTVCWKLWPKFVCVSW